MTEGPISEELQSYIENKGKLDAAFKDGISFASPYTGHVGIINQGSTCYLNSLIQCLFHDLPFRNLLLQATSDTAILLALQEIFCYLQLSESSAISTKDLVAAFGWSRGQVFEQHDVHELFGLLLDTLGDSSTEIKENVSKLYRGMMTGLL
jgi:ubiquitin carboxyl-terminal hydrolase 7